MKLGDKVYIVNAKAEAEVVYSGKNNFTAGDYTFRRAEKGEPFLGIHRLAGQAWESKEAFEKWRELHDVWSRLRYHIGQCLIPPNHISVDEAKAFLAKITRN